MTSLDRLIHKLKTRFTVSNEDAIDAVMQYWDEAADTVKRYWSDVDEEIVDELGITPTGLAELLDDNRPGFTYANVGGTSGVATYDHGDDWMVVNFTTGSRYIYTLKSTSPESLGYLKKYAIAGKGLNSYIMRQLREDYAGKNVKGQITIKPGMENYAQPANKRIALLETFRDTMSSVHQITIYKKHMEEAGQDGLGQVAKQFMEINGVC